MSRRHIRVQVSGKEGDAAAAAQTAIDKMGTTLFDLKFICDNRDGAGTDHKETRLVEGANSAMRELLNYNRRQMHVPMPRRDGDSEPATQAVPGEGTMETLNNRIAFVRLMYDDRHGSKVGREEAELIRHVYVAIKRLVDYNKDHKAPLPGPVGTRDE